MTIPNIVWQHYEDPYHRGSCDNPSHGGESACEQTGCRVAIEFRLDPLSGLCAEAWFDGEGCPMCEGLASILVERLEQRVELGGAVD